jgi:hypothetical protein
MGLVGYNGGGTVALKARKGTNKEFAEFWKDGGVLSRRLELS